jgi:hypothetical protein
MCGMDSPIVSAHIKRLIWPRLQEAGFSVFTSRAAWRHHKNRIDVLNVMSYNAYNAGVLGVTTYSFCVNLGCYQVAIPPSYEPHRIKSKAGRLLPHEAECHFSGHATRRFKQRETKDRTIWYVGPKGQYLDEAMHHCGRTTHRAVLHPAVQPGAAHRVCAHRRRSGYQ